MQPIVFLLFLSGWQSLCTQFTVGRLQSAESTNKREREKKKHLNGVNLRISRRNRLRFRMHAACATVETMSFCFAS